MSVSLQQTQRTGSPSQHAVQRKKQSDEGGDATVGGIVFRLGRPHEGPINEAVMDLVNSHFKVRMPSSWESQRASPSPWRSEKKAC